ncbi:hypothetical protein WKT22_00285 [Candidatus Lokiarchaeum ossiferum]
MFTLEAIFCLSALVPVCTSFILALINFKNKKFRHYLIMAIGWFFLSLFVLFQAFSYIFQSIWLYRISIWALVPTGVTITIFVDSLIRIRLDPIKLILVSILGTLVLYSSSLEGNISPFPFDNGDPSFQMVGVLRFTQTALNLFMSGLLVYYCFKLYIVAPLYLKSITLINLIGGFILGVITTILILTGITLVVPGIYMLPFGIGVLIMTIAMIKEPKLAFILPFKVFQLNVIKEKNGIPIFSYNWASKNKFESISEQTIKTPKTMNEADQQTLLSSLIIGIDQVFQSILLTGEISEIHLADRVILLYRDHKHPLVFMLEATQASKSLKNALIQFTKDFQNQFSEFYEEMEHIPRFEPASQYVQKNFSFIP